MKCLTERSEVKVEVKKEVKRYAQDDSFAIFLNF